ncbi:MAG: alpha-(1-_3)-arabinofuranosyltransferase family protein [Acidimicrobiales bacterium]
MRLTAPSAGGRLPPAQRRAARLEYLALAVIAFVPQLWSRPGVVTSDTKTYLYIDLGRFLRQSVSMWDPYNGLGTVTHQRIGFLWPMGPFYWAAQGLHIPVWAAQRLWVGALLFAAGAGVLYLCRTVGLQGPGRFVAAFAFMLSPYFLEYVGRISILLLPWSGLGWLLAIVIRAVRTPGWRYPALFALVWVTISGSNASAPFYVVVAPALWLPYAVLVTKEHTWREVWRAAWRIAVLSVAVSLWWVEGLLVESKYGLNLLAYTEQVSHVAATSLASEVARGLGYWYYYGSDLGRLQWANTSVGFTQDPWLLGLTFAVPVLALFAAIVLSWRRRAFFALLVVVGTVLAVATHPYAAPSVVGARLKAFMVHSTLGAALRSTDRATPMVVLGLAMFLGGGVTALALRKRSAGLAAAVLVLALVAAANPPVWNGSTVPTRFTQPSSLPGYVTKAAAALNTEHPGTRVLAIPGESFAAYRYGDTIDPIWPGLLTRPFVTREQLPLGSLPGYDLLLGLDEPMQTGTTNPAAIAPLARLMSVGDIIVQNDLEYELYNQPQPQELWQSLTPSPPGLGPATGYGTPRPNVPTVADVDPEALAAPAYPSWPSPLEVMAVSSPRKIIRAESTTGSVLLAGDGVGLNEAAGLGLLNTTAPILYSGALDGHPTQLASALAGGATLVETDTNRKQIFLWSRIQGNEGLTLPAAQRQPKYPLDLFPGAPANAQSVALYQGAASVIAEPEIPTHAPVMAIDGNPETSWQTPNGSNSLGKFWQVTLNEPVTTDHITVSQPVVGGYNYDQWITRATLQFDGGASMNVTLGPASRGAGGQTISFGERTFRTLRITITGTNLTGKSYAIRSGAAPVGLSEVGVNGVKVQEILDMPRDLLAKTGAKSQSHQLLLVMTRERSPDAVDTPASDAEATLARAFTLPTKRTFTLSGTARLSSLLPDTRVDAMVGRPGVTQGAVTASSSDRLPGDLGATASAALDGNPSTMWSPNLGKGAQLGSWIHVDLAHPVSIDHLDLQVVADGRHSVPTAIRITTENGSRDVALPAIVDKHTDDATVSMPVSFPAISGKHVTVTFTGVRFEETIGYSTRQPVALPLGIAELGIPGVHVAPAAASIPTSCRADLLIIDGHPIWTQVAGSSADALAGQGLTLTTCGPDAKGITLGAGSHVVESAPGQSAGFDVDQLVLDSAPGGGAQAGLPGTGTSLTADSTPAPAVRVLSQTATGMRLQVTGAKAHTPFWLVLGESINKGWKATVTGGPTLGASTLVDGFANGWLLDPGSRSTLSITFTWTPQATVNIALIVSLLAVVLCLALALWPRRRPTRAQRRGRAVALSAAGVSETAGVPMEPATVGTRGGEALQPTLLNPFGAGETVPMWIVLAAAAGTALVTAAIVPPATLLPAPLVGLGVGAAIVLALIFPPLRGLIGLVTVGFALGAALYTIVAQANGHFLASSWPSHFERANVLMWTALAFLTADIVVGLVRNRRH